MSVRLSILTNDVYAAKRKLNNVLTCLCCRKPWRNNYQLYRDFYSLKIKYVNLLNTLANQTNYNV